ncbi:MAG: fibronectin type III domain-containing protein [Ferruginibacter sp.]
MKKNITISVIYLLASLSSLSQNRDFGKLLVSGASPRGNYVFLFNDLELLEKDKTLFESTAYFLVERILHDSIADNMKKAGFKKIAELKPVSDIKSLKAFYSSDQVVEIKNVFKLSSDKMLIEYFQTHHRASDFPFFYEIVETRQAMGHVFLDKNVKVGEHYMYKITRVLKNKTTEPWGYTLVQSKSGNEQLDQLAPRVTAVKGYDSSVTITWKMPVPKNAAPGSQSEKPLLSQKKKKISYGFPLELANTRAKIFVTEDGRFKEAKKLFPVVNKTKDTVTYTFSKRCMPEDAVAAYMVTEDEIYNEGPVSDTAFAFAIEEKSIPLILGVRSQDILNGVRLSWNPLPSKPYITGIEIKRYSDDKTLDSVATLPPTDTSFIDYNMAVGVNYRYQVKALFLPAIGIEQKMPAQTAGTYTKFSRPLPAFNLVAEVSKNNIQLKWDAVDETSLYGYYVYRGTSPRSFDLIAGPIKIKSYLDSAASLSGRTAYYYKVLTQNLRQDTSEYSPVVRIVPERAIEITQPDNLDFYYVNGVVRISWNDVRTNDNAIEKFLLQKRAKGEKDFITLTAKPVNQNYVDDSLITEGVEYEYRVASVSFKGDVSGYGNAAGYILPKRDLMPMKIFYVRNTTEGITITWPQVLMGRKSYNIYRREASEEKFIKIKTVPADTFSFVDKTAAANTIYVYSLTASETDDRESARIKSISIRRTIK